MSNRSSDILFQLIHSLEKAEKRHFKLYIKRSSSNENLKIVQLFDAIDKLKTYNEADLLKRLPGIQKAQLHNLKTHLYKQILSSLRLLKSTDSMDLQLNELFDHAHILYKKGLFYQSLRLLEKAKETARANQKFHFLTLVLGLEKRIESQHITKAIQDHAERLAAESTKVSQHIDLLTRLSNLALQLYSWHVKRGPVRNDADEMELTNLLQNNLPKRDPKGWGFYESLYYYQSMTWYTLLRNDFLACYTYAQKCVGLFHLNATMKRVETSYYIKALHYLLNVHFELLNYGAFLHTLSELEAFSKTDRVQENDNFRVQCLIYLAQARMNLYFMTGHFEKGLPLVRAIEEQLSDNALFIDQHRILVLHYKMALFYFACQNYSACIDYAQKIINEAIDLRYDLQGNARLLHLLAHYEEGNYDLMQYLSKSVQRFLSKDKQLSPMETEAFRVLRATPRLTKSSLKQQLLQFMEESQNNGKGDNQITYTSGSAYLYIWIESKATGKTIDQLVQEKYKARKRSVAVSQ